MNEFEIEEAKSIISKSLKTKKLLVEFSGWLKLDEEVRNKALKEMSCPICKKVVTLDGIHSFIYEKVVCCSKCDDKNQFPHLLSSN